MKKIVIITAVVLLALGSVSALFIFHRAAQSKSPKSPMSSPISAPVSGINYNPPTPTEQTAGDQQKAVIVKNNVAAVTPPSVANVVIVDANQYDSTVEVRAYISNVIQNGICTVTFTKGTLSVTKTSTAFKDATTTQCTILKLARSAFEQTGTWSVTVSYKADGILGQSVNSNLEIK